nr:Chain C, Insulin [Homo sapiens]4WDI_F Chain F, Insulin [Homo sapiens]
LYLVCGERG